MIEPELSYLVVPGAIEVERPVPAEAEVGLAMRVEVRRSLESALVRIEVYNGIFLDEQIDAR